MENKKEIKGVKCEAENCVYNKYGCICDAGSIEVGTHSATSCDETVCTTFKCKK